MSSQHNTATLPPLDFSKWRKVPQVLMAVGGLGALIGIAVPALREQFAFSWLLAFMFFLSVGLGSLFLVLVHHLFDAGWSVPIRRVCEHLSTLLFPSMAVLFIPIAVMAPVLYKWMRVVDVHSDHALAAKQPLFTRPSFYIAAVICFGVWGLLTNRLRYWSLEQDKTGAAQCTHKMRFFAYWGIFAFALTLTTGVIMWMKALQHQWFSTMYGVYYFAGSVWMTLALVYFLTMVLNRQGAISHVLHEHQFYFIGSLQFAFTVFWAYITFSQYFIIWNANMPEETFWYVLREKGSWWGLSMVIIFGHFFFPFLTLLRIDAKETFALMVPLGIWAWMMHFCDLSFNIMPVLHPDGFVLHWLDLSCLALMAGFLATRFLKDLNSHPPYPLKDPRLSEAMGLYHPVPTQLSGGELDETDRFRDARVNAK